MRLNEEKRGKKEEKKRRRRRRTIEGREKKIGKDEVIMKEMRN